MYKNTKMNWKIKISSKIYLKKIYGHLFLLEFWANFDFLVHFNVLVHVFTIIWSIILMSYRLFHPKVHLISNLWPLFYFLIAKGYFWTNKFIYHWVQGIVCTCFLPLFIVYYAKSFISTFISILNFVHSIRRYLSISFETWSML